MIQNHIEGGGKWDGSRYQEICLYFRTKNDYLYGKSIKSNLL